MRRTLAGLCAFVAVATLAAQPQKPSPQEVQLARWRAQLLGPDPLALGSAERGLLLARLVRSDDVRAHEILHGLLARIDREKGIAASTALLVKLCEQEGLDLAPEKLVPPEGQEARLATRLAIYEGYVPVLVALRGKLVTARREDARCQQALERFFLWLPGPMRRASLKKIFTKPGHALERLAILVAAETRDPLMAAELAPLLSEDSLRADVQAALQRLTLVAKPFDDLEAFVRWQQRNTGKTYEALAREAALAALAQEKRFARERVAGEARQRAKLVELAEGILELALSASSPPWGMVGELFDDEGLAAARPRLCDRLTELLRPRLSGAARPASTPELAAFHARFARGLAAEPERAYWLGPWAFSAILLGGEASDRAEQGLCERLDKDAAERPRIYGLLSAFGSDRARRRLLDRLEKVDADAELKLGLACLAEFGSSKEATHTGRTLAFLERSVRNPALATETRELALSLIGALDSPSVITTYRGLVAKGREGVLPDALRLLALIRVNKYVGSRLAGANGKAEVQARAHTGFLVTCLVDRSPLLRAEAARTLAGWPPAITQFSREFLREVGGRVLGAVGRALRSEKDPATARELLGVVALQARRSELFAQALVELVAVCRAWAAERSVGRAHLRAQLPGITKDLATLARGKGLRSATLCDQAGSLVDAGLWRGAFGLLGAAPLAEIEAEDRTSRGPLAAEAIRRRMLERGRKAGLLLRLGELSASGTPLDPKPATPAERRAFETLVVASSRSLLEASGEHATALLLLGASRHSLGDSGEAVEPLALFVARSGVDAADLLTAKRLLAHAKLAVGKPAEAAEVLVGLGEIDDRLLRAKALQSARKFADAVVEYQAIVTDGKIGAKDARREDALLGVAESLLGADQLGDCERYLDGLPKLDRETSKERLRAVRDRLAARKRADGSGANGKELPGKQGAPAGPGRG